MKKVVYPKPYRSTINCSISSNPKFKDVDVVYTGGNINLYFGVLQDGSYFIADDSNFFVTFVDENVMEFDDIPEMDWYDSHTTYEVPEEDGFRFMKSMYEWIKKNKPSVYDANDLVWHENELDGYM